MVQQRIHERSRCMPRCRMHHEACRLIHHHDVLVFVHHGERNVFGEHRRFAHRWNHKVQCLPRNQRGAGTYDETTHCEMALGDESLHKRAREPAPICDKPVSTLPRRLRRDRQI